MYKFYEDYYWSKGRPKGKNPIDSCEFNKIECYRIVVDPYFKRYTIEFYKKGKFYEIVYDSALFDFRKLKPVEQNAWKKELVSETSFESICYIKDHDDRIILTEKYQFQQSLCIVCWTSYPNGQHLSTQKTTYKKLGNSSNETILYDRLNHPVLIKEYEADEVTGEFTNLLKEVWDFND